jgi:hypothetical protein
MARIDWDAIERHQTLDELAAPMPSWSKPCPNRCIALGLERESISVKLRKAWPERQITRFHDDVATLVPSPVWSSRFPTAS